MYQVPSNCCSVSSDTANISFISQSVTSSGSERSDLRFAEIFGLLTFQCEAASLDDVAGRHLVEEFVLVVESAVEGAGLIVSTGDQTGQGLETVPVSETGQSLPAALSHHTDQVWADCPLWWSEIVPQIRAGPGKVTSSEIKSLRTNKHLVKFLRLFY